MSVLPEIIRGQNARLVEPYEKETGESDARMANFEKRMITMLDKEKLNSVAVVAFQIRIGKQVEWLATKCWTSSLNGQLKELNQIIVAANQLGVSETKKFSEEQLNAMVDDLTPLRNLEMKGEAHEYLTDALRRQGLEKQYIPSKPKTNDD